MVHTIVADGTDLLAGTGRGVARSADGGSTWAPAAGALADHRIFSLLVTHDRRVLAGSYEGVWASAGGGAWTPLDTGMSVGESFVVAWRDDSMAVAGGRGGPFQFGRRRNDVAAARRRRRRGSDVRCLLHPLR